MDPNMNAQNMNLKMSDTKAVTCDKCGCMAFTPVTLLRRISALISPTAKEAVAPIQAYTCIKCGHINVEFLPKGITEEEANGK